MPEKPDNLESCEIFCSDPAKVNFVKGRLEGLQVGVDIFKALGDQTRFKLVYALWHEELCVCDLALALDLPIAAISYHLRYLRSLRLVKPEKRGKMVFYSLADDHVSSLVHLALEHMQENNYENSRGG